MVSAALGEPVVVILPLLILRPHRRPVRADYPAWAINQPDAQRRLDREAQATGLRMVPKTVVERLDIPLPEMATQRHIAAIHTRTTPDDRPDHPTAEQPNRLGRLRHPTRQSIASSTVTTRRAPAGA